eukprot:scpid43969/ scgid7029/ 
MPLTAKSKKASGSSSNNTDSPKTKAKKRPKQTNTALPDISSPIAVVSSTRSDLQQKKTAEEESQDPAATSSPARRRTLTSLLSKKLSKKKTSTGGGTGSASKAASSSSADAAAAADRTPPSTARSITDEALHSFNIRTVALASASGGTATSVSIEVTRATTCGDVVEELVRQANEVQQRERETRTATGVGVDVGGGSNGQLCHKDFCLCQVLRDGDTCRFKQLSSKSLIVTECTHSPAVTSHSPASTQRPDNDSTLYVCREAKFPGAYPVATDTDTAQLKQNSGGLSLMVAALARHRAFVDIDLPAGHSLMTVKDVIENALSKIASSNSSSSSNNAKGRLQLSSSDCQFLMINTTAACSTARDRAVRDCGAVPYRDWCSGGHRLSSSTSSSNSSASTQQDTVVRQEMSTNDLCKMVSDGQHIVQLIKRPRGEKHLQNGHGLSKARSQPLAKPDFMLLPPDAVVSGPADGVRGSDGENEDEDDNLPIGMFTRNGGSRRSARLRAQMNRSLRGGIGGMMARVADGKNSANAPAQWTHLRMRKSEHDPPTITALTIAEETTTRSTENLNIVVEDASIERSGASQGADPDTPPPSGGDRHTHHVHVTAPNAEDSAPMGAGRDVHSKASMHVQTTHARTDAEHTVELGMAAEDTRQDVRNSSESELKNVAVTNSAECQLNLPSDTSHKHGVEYAHAPTIVITAVPACSVDSCGQEQGDECNTEQQDECGMELTNSTSAAVQLTNHAILSEELRLDSTSERNAEEKQDDARQTSAEEQVISSDVMEDMDPGNTMEGTADTAALTHPHQSDEQKQEANRYGQDRDAHNTPAVTHSQKVTIDSTSVEPAMIDAAAEAVTVKTGESGELESGKHVGPTSSNQAVPTSVPSTVPSEVPSIPQIGTINNVSEEQYQSTTTNFAVSQHDTNEIGLAVYTTVDINAEITTDTAPGISADIIPDVATNPTDNTPDNIPVDITGAALGSSTVDAYQAMVTEVVAETTMDRTGTPAAKTAVESGGAHTTALVTPTEAAAEAEAEPAAETAAETAPETAPETAAEATAAELTRASAAEAAVVHECPDQAGDGSVVVTSAAEHSDDTSTTSSHTQYTEYTECSDVGLNQQLCDMNEKTEKQEPEYDTLHNSTVTDQLANSGEHSQLEEVSAVESLPSISEYRDELVMCSEVAASTPALDSPHDELADAKHDEGDNSTSTPAHLPQLASSSPESHGTTQGMNTSGESVNTISEEMQDSSDAPSHPSPALIVSESVGISSNNMAACKDPVSDVVLDSGLATDSASSSAKLQEPAGDDDISDSHTREVENHTTVAESLSSDSTLPEQPSTSLPLRPPSPHGCDAQAEWLSFQQASGTSTTPTTNTPLDSEVAVSSAVCNTEQQSCSGLVTRHDSNACKHVGIVDADLAITMPAPVPSAHQQAQSILHDTVPDCASRELGNSLTNAGIVKEELMAGVACSAQPSSALSAQTNEEIQRKSTVEKDEVISVDHRLDTEEPSPCSKDSHAVVHSQLILHTTALDPDLVKPGVNTQERGAPSSVLATDNDNIIINTIDLPQDKDSADADMQDSTTDSMAGENLEGNSLGIMDAKHDVTERKHAADGHLDPGTMVAARPKEEYESSPTPQQTELRTTDGDASATEVLSNADVHSKPLPQCQQQQQQQKDPMQQQQDEQQEKHQGTIVLQNPQPVQHTAGESDELTSTNQLITPSTKSQSNVASQSVDNEPAAVEVPLVRRRHSMPIFPPAAITRVKKPVRHFAKQCDVATPSMHEYEAQEQGSVNNGDAGEEEDTVLVADMMGRFKAAQELFGTRNTPKPTESVPVPPVTKPAGRRYSAGESARPAVRPKSSGKANPVKPPAPAKPKPSAKPTIQSKTAVSSPSNAASSAVSGAALQPLPVSPAKPQTAKRPAPPPKPPVRSRSKSVGSLPAVTASRINQRAAQKLEAMSEATCDSLHDEQDQPAKPVATALKTDKEFDRKTGTEDKLTVDSQHSHDRHLQQQQQQQQQVDKGHHGLASALPEQDAPQHTVYEENVGIDTNLELLDRDTESTARSLRHSASDEDLPAIELPVRSSLDDDTDQLIAMLLSLSGTDHDGLELDSDDAFGELSGDDDDDGGTSSAKGRPSRCRSLDSSFEHSLNSSGTFHRLQDLERELDRMENRLQELPED